MNLTKRDYRRLKIAEISAALDALDDALCGAAWMPSSQSTGASHSVLGLLEQVRDYRDFLKTTPLKDWPTLAAHIRSSRALRSAYLRRFSR